MARRFPAQIGNWTVNEGEPYSVEGLLTLLRVVIRGTLTQCKKPGILLSGGIDSSILALLANEIQRIPCFTIGSSSHHPDVQAATRLAGEFNLDHRIYLPSTFAQEDARASLGDPFPGDEGVLLALQFASRFTTDILATDGIDEQMGGYWWHVNRNDEFSTAEMAFKAFWDELEPKHLTPMFCSAEMAGVNIHWVYLFPEVVEYVSRIPLAERTRDGTRKYFWREVARKVGVPEWVIDRPKRGFVDALT